MIKKFFNFKIKKISFFDFSFGKTERGFSLVELLFVIAIVGLLSSIVLGSISKSRARAYDSKVKQQLGSFRTAAEIYFSNNGRYNETDGVPVVSCNAGMFNNISPTNGSPGLYILEGNLPYNTIVVCGATDSTYAVKATLYSGSEYWCVDNKGSARLISDEIGNPTDVCP